MAYSAQDLAVMFNMSKRTLERRLQTIKESNQFVKSSPGKFYNDVEAMQIAGLLGYSFTPPKESRQIPPLFNLKFT